MNFLIRLFVFGFLILEMGLSAHAQVVAVPYGVFRVRSGVTNNEYHLVVTEDASILAPGAFLMEIPRSCGRPRVEDRFNVHIPFLKPYWNPQSGQMSVRGNTMRDMNSVFTQFLDRDRIEGHFTTTNFEFERGYQAQELRRFPYTGERIQAETDLIDLARNSLVNSPRKEEAQGVYEGRLEDGTSIRLILTLNTHEPQDHWDSRLDFGTSNRLPLVGSSSAQAGLIRMVRPVQDPRWVSGITGTVVETAGEPMEFRGFYFVVRTGCINPIVLRKVRPVNAH